MWRPFSGVLLLLLASAIAIAEASPDVLVSINNKEAHSHAEYIRAEKEDARAQALVSKATLLAAKIAKLRAARDKLYASEPAPSEPAPSEKPGVHLRRQKVQPSVATLSAAALSWAVDDIRRTMAPVEKRGKMKRGKVLRSSRELARRKASYSSRDSDENARDSRLLDFSDHVRDKPQVIYEQRSRTPRERVSRARDIFRDDVRLAREDSPVLSARKILREDEKIARDDGIVEPPAMPSLSSDDDIHVKVEGGCQSACAPTCCNQGLVNLITSIIDKQVGQPGLNGINGLNGVAGKKSTNLYASEPAPSEGQAPRLPPALLPSFSAPTVQP